MVKAELSYNPYLMETIIKFNGQSPKINSPVEKYQEGKLHLWIDKLPFIFRDEMNGYDFELEYSGLQSDFESVRRAFVEAGVGDDEVKFFYKNELEPAGIKSGRIDDLLVWLDENRNRRFDFERFMDNNRELFDDPYTYIIVHGNGVDISSIDKKIAVECVETVDELENTVIEYTPILFYIDSEINFRENLKTLLRREDVNENQIFFYIHPMLNRTQIERVIKDLGVNKPQVVLSVADEKIMEYFDIYPISDYIKNTISVLREYVQKLEIVLNDENEKSIVINAGIHEKIDILEDEIRRLKHADELICQRDNIGTPEGVTSAVNSFKEKIEKWRRKKTKTTRQDEAHQMAVEFDNELKKYFAAFLSDIENVFMMEIANISSKYEQWYSDTQVDGEFKVDISCEMSEKSFYSPALVDEFMSMKEEKYVMPKEDFFGAIFSSGEKKAQEPVLETTYYYETWRGKALEVHLAILKSAVDSKFESIKKYYDELAVVYHDKLESLIMGKNVEKDQTIAQLSDDERQLQLDNDWLASLKEKIELIERG